MTTVTEKLTPGLLDFIPKEDPLRHDQTDSSGSAVEMHLSWVMKQREKMHRKHRLDRKRKRDRVRIEKRARVKALRKEAQIRAVEQEWAGKAQVFDPQMVFEDRIKLATAGGWQCNDVFERLKQLELQDQEKKNKNDDCS